MNLNKTGFTCTCDYFFYGNKQLCEHILFMFIRVAQMSTEEIFGTFLDDSMDFCLTGGLKKRIREGIKKGLVKYNKTNAPTIESENTHPTECAICFEGFTDKNKGIQRCTTCSKILHFSCMIIWKNTCDNGGRSFTCPCCRTLLILSNNHDDYLSKMINKKRTKKQKTTNPTPTPS